MTFVKTALFHKAGEGSGGGGGGDQHNLGWYATESALTTAHATATDGDWAIVGSTDTVWVWDSDSTGWKDTGAAGIELPDQTGKSGEFLTTDGSSASWTNYQNRPFVNKATKYNCVGLGLTTTVTGGGEKNILIGAGAGFSPRSGRYTTGSGILIAGNTSRVGAGGVAIGGQGVNNASDHSLTGYDMDHGVAVGCDSCSFEEYSSAFGASARAMKTGSIQMGSGTNSETGTFCVGLTTSVSPYASNNYKLLDSDGTIPTARFATDPSADGTYVPTLTISSGVATRSWSAPSGGLPSQTGNAGKFLTTDGTDVSWSDKPLVNASTGTLSLSVGGNGTTQMMTTNVGSGATNNGSQSVAVGTNSAAGQQGVSIGMASSTNTGGIAIGFSIQAGSDAVAIRGSATASYAIQIGRGSNADASTFKVGLGVNKNYELLSADGTIPEARLADTTNAQQGDVLTLDSTGNAVWQAGGGGSSPTQTSIQIDMIDWQSNGGGGYYCNVSVQGVTLNNIVFVSADDPISMTEWANCKIMCTNQAPNQLTFECETQPNNPVNVNIVIFN